MLGLFTIPAILGLGLAYDFISDQRDEEEEQTDIRDDPIQITMAEDAVIFDGTEAKEHVQANAHDNTLRGGDGNDKLSGLGGDDTIDAGAGDDRIFGGDGNDEAIGGAGNDRIFLGGGNDVSISSEDGSADAGDDLIRGGAGQDSIADGYGSNTIYGDTGRDVISTIDDPLSQGTADTVHGGYGNDTVIGDAGDLLTGGEGDDNFVVAARSDTSEAPAMLIDFNVQEDLFSVVLLETPDAPPEITFEHLPDTNQLAAVVNGQQVALLNDIDAGDIPFIRTFVTSLAALT